MRDETTARLRAGMRVVWLFLLLSAPALPEDLARYLILEGTTLDLRGKQVAAEEWPQLRGAGFAKVRRVLLARSNADDAALAQLTLMQPEELDLFGTAVTVSGLRVLRRDRLRKIDLSGTAITAEALELLASLVVEELSLRDTALSDDATSLLLRFPALRRLDLSMTRVGDRTLAALVRHPSLRLLDMSGTRVSASAVAEAKKNRPELTVVVQMPSR